MKVTIGIADDQQLFVRSMAALINQFARFEVVLEAVGGMELLDKLGKTAVRPQIVLVDVNMPGMNGIDTARALVRNFSDIRVVALSMQEDDMTMISLLKAGCCACLSKGIHHTELECALEEIERFGYYNADPANILFRRSDLFAKNPHGSQLTGQERAFVQLACSERSYKQVAAKMKVPKHVIDSYCESVYAKLHVQSRVGMVMEAIRKNLVTV